jgi:tRNA1Val (adenine37-N6)-methyltransferase
MKHQYFIFKQFQITQDKCSMKVGTDGVLLGCLGGNSNPNGNILDIGTGTGLIALMMAQRYPDANIFGIDANLSAYIQATENCKASPWSNRIKIIHTKLQNYQSTELFDCVISNPPFYNQAKQSPDISRAQSRNEEFLPAEYIFQFTQSHISPNGQLWLIYPTEQLYEIERIAKQYGLFPFSLHYFRPNILKTCHRVIIGFSKTEQSNSQIRIICIEKLKRHDYTDDYRKICQEFYLHF